MPVVAWRQPKREHLLLGVIVGAAAFLIFFRLTRADVQTDAGHYSARALGYLDFVDSMRQTTPFQWYAPSPPPAWTKLSFHDHPPLVFGIQHLFFRLAGESDFVALLPFGISGVAAVCLLFAIGRQWYGARLGLLAAGLAAVSTFAVWSARIGYLEGVENAFILVAVWLFGKALANRRWLPAWGAALGIAVLAKYSALFLVPTFLGFILLRQRAWFKERNFWLALLCASAVLSPVMIYNAKLWAARGHLDVQLSTLLPAARPAATLAWPLLFSGPRFVNPAVNFRDLARTVALAHSLPLTLVLAGGLLALLVRLGRAPRAAGDVLLALGAGTLAVFFTLTAPSQRYLPIVVPWLVMPAAVGVMQLWGRRWGRWRGAAVVAFGAALVSELAFNWNTNHALRPYGQAGRNYAAYRQERLGFQELAAFLQPRLASSPSYRRAATPPESFAAWEQVHLGRGDDVLLYDDGLRWFSAFWYLRRYRLYHGVDALMPAADLGPSGLLEKWPEVFRRAGVRTVYLVVGDNRALYDPWAVEAGESSPVRQIARQLQERIDRGAPGKVTPIASRLGEPAFKVYEIPLNR